MGLKSSGAAFHAHLANALQSLGFISSLADPDVWYRAAIKPNGKKYYEYLLTYVDDILLLSSDPHIVFKQLTEIYRFKEPPGKPKKYLGTDIFEFYFPNDPNVLRTVCEGSCANGEGGIVQEGSFVTKEMLITLCKWLPSRIRFYTLIGT